MKGLQESPKRSKTETSVSWETSVMGGCRTKFVCTFTESQARHSEVCVYVCVCVCACVWEVSPPVPLAGEGRNAALAKINMVHL